ncbi:MAG: IS4 family transposase [Acetobacteraceae bacterium]
MADRNASFHPRQHPSRIQRQARQMQAVDFFNMLTGAELLERTEALLPEHRERRYPPTVTLAMFLRQALSADRSCQRAVDGWIAQCVAEGLAPPSARTGGYSRARARLPTSMVSTLARESGAWLSAHTPAPWRWRGRVVKLADGTTLSMPDTEANQARYPQPCTQAPGVGFPLLRLAGVISLATGAVLGAAIGPSAGKGSGELTLIRELEDTLQAGDIFLADALYCNYFLLARPQERGVDAVCEQNGSRGTDFRRGERLAARDHLVDWRKPATCPQWMSPEHYQRAPATLRVREVRVGGRVLVTTLLNPRQAPKRELGKLYVQRWNIELDLRHIKTTLGLEILSCKSPAMCEKELWVYLLAYNLIRLLMAQAALQAHVTPCEISFKHAVQLWTAWVTLRLVDAHALRRTFLLNAIAQQQVGHRPRRIEPRARKRRPKPYQWLKVPRAKARQQIRRLGYLPNPQPLM